MKKLLILLLPLFAFTCSRVAVPQSASIYLDSINTNIVSNDLVSENLLSKYTGFTINKTSSKYTINIKGDTSNSFSIISKNDTINISGNALAGVVYFLDKYVGVRFYMPTDLWTSQRKDSILIDSNISITHTPFTQVIFSTGLNTNPESYWQLYNNIGNYSLGITQHSFSILFYDSAMLKLFPSVYKNGFPKSVSDQDFEPDFTSPEMVAASMYAARNFFEWRSRGRYISFSVMDGGGFPNPVSGKTLSQSFTDYINSLADSFKIVFPDKIITYLIYSKVSSFPTVKLRDNVLPITVLHMVDATPNKLYDDIGVAKVAPFLPHLGNHDWAEGYLFLIPRIYNKILDSTLLCWKRHNVNLDFAHLEMYPNWAVDGIKYYVMAKVYDNPYQNLDSIQNLFCVDMFGVGALQMETYFETIDQLSTSMFNNPLHRRIMGGYASQLYLSAQDSTLAATAKNYLDAAYKATTGIEHSRVNFFENGYRIFGDLFKIYNGKQGLTFITSYENFLRDSINGNQMYLNIASSPTFLSDMNNLIKSDKVK